MKLFIFNVTSDDSGKFSCQVTAESWDRFTEFYLTSNVQVDVAGKLKVKFRNICICH